MRLDLFAAAAMVIVHVAQPAGAQEDPGSEPASESPMAPRVAYEDPVNYGLHSAAREAWLADCRQRLSANASWMRGRAIDRDECEAYLDDYYARYMRGSYYPAPPYGHSYPQGYGYVAPAAPYAYMAQPMMMVPVASAKPECIETVEYVYEDVPPRPAPRRRYIPRPSKMVPDKRAPIK